MTTGAVPADAVARAERRTAADHRAPTSTYRLQITAGFTLNDAAAWIDYLHRLGADWVYCSPLLQAAAGSDHGYDVVDHARTDAARGGREGLGTLADAAHRAGLGVLVDIVPNHVGVATPAEVPWWWDVLRHGPGSVHADAFDIDWAAGGGKILLPVLGDGPAGDPTGELAHLRVDDGDLCYYEHRFPIAPGTGQGSPREVHDRQHYRLVNFRLADTRLNYRRFFAVNSLAAIRVEDAGVFAASHREIRHWIDAGWVDGLRVDHPDGLADPAGYLRDLADVTGGRYTVVEKILEPGEELPSEWACEGTTGYETLAAIDRLLIDPAGQRVLDDLDTRLRGSRADWPAMVHEAKLAVAEGILNSEVRRLARVLTDAPPGPGPDDPDAVGDGTDAPLREAIAELVANFGVYWTYVPARDPDFADAVARAREHRPDLRATFARLGAAGVDTAGEFAVRLQQTTGAVMAKGVEDCAFYRYPRLVSLTEVGGDPAVFAATAAKFHAAQRRRLATWPAGMTTLSTHDTKRGEDVRARIHVLAECPATWAAAVDRWLDRLDLPDRVLGHLLLQTAVGAWPIDRERFRRYAEKSAREAGTSTGWVDPDPAFEKRLGAFVDALYDDPVVSGELADFADRIRPAGWSNSLAAKLIQLTLPGVPDVYRGTELWRDDLVDPDNRRPFAALADGGAAALLRRLDEGWRPAVDASGAAKLLVTSRALRARRDRPELFRTYRPVEATGPAAEHLVGFDRGGAVTVATRLPAGLAARGGWRTTTVSLPAGRWRDELSGRHFGDDAAQDDAGAAGNVVIPAAELVADYPVALLLREAPDGPTPPA